MIDFYDPIVAEVRENRRKLFERYGGIEGWNKHMDEMRVRLEKEGWHYLTDEEEARLKAKHKNPPVSELLAEIEREESAL